MPSNNNANAKATQIRSMDLLLSARSGPENFFTAALIVLHLDADKTDSGSLGKTFVKLSLPTAIGDTNRSQDPDGPHKDYQDSNTRRVY
jgi:hypothetical protein